MRRVPTRIELRFAILVVLLAALVSCPSWATETQTDKAPSGRLKLATCQFPISADISENARWIRRQIREAAQKGAHLVHFPETALSGYASADHKSLDRLDWQLLRREMQSIMALAKQNRVWVVLGSTHRLSKGHMPHNSLYLIDDQGQVVDRYDKRFCTEGDLRHYSPGDHLVVFELNGVKCGQLICHDYRYPELYREYARRGVRLLLHSFYNSSKSDKAVRRKLTAEYAQVYSSMNNMFVSYTNTSRRWSWPACFTTPDGQIAATLPQNQPGVMLNEVDVHHKYYDASRRFRPDAIRGKLNSGQTVDDPRSKDRTAY